MLCVCVCMHKQENQIIKKINFTKITKTEKVAFLADFACLFRHDPLVLLIYDRYEKRENFKES